MLTSFLAYMVVLILIGYFAFRRSRPGVDDYLLSGRDHGPWMTALSASASSESGWVMLGLVGMGYTLGLSCLWLLPGCVAGYLFNWLVLGPRIHDLATANGARSIPELLELRFSASSKGMRWLLRFVGMVLVISFMSFYVGVQFVAGGKALEAMFGWSYSVGVLITAGLVLCYTVLGGLRAISWTDVLQAIVMAASLILLATLLLLSGSVSTGSTGDTSSLFNWSGGSTGWAAVGFVIGWVGIGLGYPGQPHVLKRFLSAGSRAVFGKGALIALVWSQVVFTAAIILGVAGRYAYPEIADPEQLLPLAAVDTLPPWIAGLVLAAVFSAICSTADSQLLEVGAAISYDAPALFRHTRNDDKRFVLAARVAIVTAGLFAAVVAASFVPLVFSMVLYSWAALGAGFGAVFSVALLWTRCSAVGALLGLLAGPITVILWKSVFGLSGFLYELVPAFAVSLAVIILGSWLFPERLPLLGDAEEDEHQQLAPAQGGD